MWHVRRRHSAWQQLARHAGSLASHMISRGSYQPWATTVELSDLVCVTEASNLDLGGFIGVEQHPDCTHLWSEILYMSKSTIL